MKDLYIQGIFNELGGLRDQSLADLNVFLSNPVGIGEHANISKEIKNKIEEIDKYDSLFATMQKYFSASTDEGDPSTNVPPPARVLDEGEDE